MKKKALIIILTLCFVGAIALLFVANQNEKATIFVATDTHYISNRINDKGEAFQKAMEQSDGKLVECCDEIMDALADEAIKQKPAVLILSGDLTLNGERASHEDLVKKLNYIQDNGVQVLTIAGNHDINSKSSAKYVGNKAVEAENINAQEYKEMYFSFGMEQAESVDTASLSYTYKVNDDLYILMLDTNAFGQNFIQDPSYEWIENQLKSIKKKHAKVISVTHQNLFAHNNQLSFGYQLYDAKELLEMLNKYKVKLNLSGHIHMQHIMKDGIAEVTTSSLLVAPIQYGVIDFSRNICYHTEKLNVDSVEGFTQYAQNQFKQSGINKSTAMLEKSDLTEEQKKLIANTFAELNASYFAGTKLDIKPFEEGIELIEQQDGFMKNYIEIMVDEAKNDYTKITIR